MYTLYYILLVHIIIYNNTQLANTHSPRLKIL